MKLAIFGGSGRTGQHLVRGALEQGYQVSALARTPEKLSGLVSPGDARLTVIRGDLSDAAAIEQVIAGVDAVISTLGPTSNQPTFEVSQGTRLILETMQRHGVRRIIISAGAGVGDPADSPRLFNHLINFLLKTTAKNVYLDMVKTVELVRASDLDWTVVRVPMLTDDPPKGQIRVGMVGDGMGPRITRADMADYLLQQVESRQQLHRAPAISN